MVLQGMAMNFARLSSVPSFRITPRTSSSSVPFLLPRRNSQQQLFDFDQQNNNLLHNNNNPLVSHFSSSGCRLFPVDTPDKGIGGAYFLKDGDKPAAVFKPSDEEAVPDEEQAKDLFLGKEIKPGLLYGEGYLKEVAAYLLDREHFHGVPPTMLFRVKHPVIQDTEVNPKLGSLQQYVSHNCTAEDIGWNLFPVDEVHKIGILDCRILNNDRHLGNILVVIDSGYHLVPIDHGLCLPSSLSGADFGWLSLPQCKKPFSKKMLEYIENLDVEADLEMLEKQLPLLRKECLDTLRICTMFLKKAAKAGLNLFEIGCLMSKYNLESQDEPTLLETICSTAQQTVREDMKYMPDAAEEDSLRWAVLSKEMDNALYNYCNTK